MLEKIWNRDLWSWLLGKLPCLRLVTFDPKFWADHLEVEFAIDSNMFAHKQTLNNTFASAVYTCSVFWRFCSVEFLVELDVTSTRLLSICAWFLFPVLLCWGEFCCVVLCWVALRFVVIHYVVLRCVELRSVVLCCVCFVGLRCVGLRSVVSVLRYICWVALRCDPLRCVALWSVVLRCVVIRCVTLPCAVLRCWQVQHF